MIQLTENEGKSFIRSEEFVGSYIKEKTEILQLLRIKDIVILNIAQALEIQIPSNPSRKKKKTKYNSYLIFLNHNWFVVDET